MRPIRVLVIDDHEIVRIGLRALLGREQDIHVVGMAANGDEGLQLVDELMPDVAVVDYSLGPISGVEVCEKITERHPEVPVIMLSTFLDDEVIHRSIQAGAKAYVYKDVEGRDIKRMIRTVAEGKAVLDPKVAGRVMGWASGQRSQPGQTPLSAREVEVLRFVSRGVSNPEMARQMGISLNTVKTYLRRALEKLDCKTRAEAAAAASRLGIL